MFIPDAIGLLLAVFCVFFPFGVKPLAGINAGLCGKTGVNFPIVATDKFANLFFALDHHGQGGGLHPTHGGQKEATVARVEGRHGPGAIDADQPIGLAAAAGGVGQALHLGVAAEFVKTIADGLRRHGLQPQAFDGLAEGLKSARLGAARVLLDEPKDQLAFTARVTGVDEGAHVFALGLFDHRVQTGFGFVHGLEVEEGRDHGQVGKAPFAAFYIELFGRLDFDQMPHGAGHHVLVVLEMLVVFFKFAAAGRQRAHDVLRHRGFFCDHQCFGHSILSLCCAHPVWNRWRAGSYNLTIKHRGHGSISPFPFFKLTDF